MQGVDPDPNVHDNPYISEAFQGLIEELETSHKFNLVTLRMVAEHVERPDLVVSKLASLLKPGGLAVIFTPTKWAPISVVARLVPFRLHHPIKRWLWGVQPRDTFPVKFRMNSRRALRECFDKAGMKECLFMRLDDCRAFARFRWLSRLELQTRTALSCLNLPYPEACILAAYNR